MSFPSHDSYWQSVAALLRQRAKPLDRVLAPEQFRFVIATAARYADTYFDPSGHYDWIVIHKGEMRLLRRSFFTTLLDDATPVYANAVFVVFARAPDAMPVVRDDDPHLASFFERLNLIVRHDGPVSPAGSPLAREDDPSAWFTSDERVDHVLRFLDARIASERPAGAPTAATPSRSRQPLSEFQPLRAVPASPSEVAATVAHPIGNIRSALQDMKSRGFVPRGLVDVGANVGEWTRMALAIFPDLAFVLIEPQRELAERLTALVAGRPDCHFVNAGAGRSAGEAIQTISEDPGASSFLPIPDPVAQSSGRQRSTPIVRIDDLFGADGPCRTLPPDLVKLDVQGFEMEVLAGAETLFGRTELFIIETSLYEFMPRQPLAREMIAFMASRGYEIYEITEFGRRPYDGALGQVDFAFARSAGLLRSSNAW